MLRDFRESRTDPSLQLADFPIFGTRLQHIHQRMADWRPLRVSELLAPTIWRLSPLLRDFGLRTFIGVVGLIGVFLNVAQVVFSILSWKNN